VREHNEAVNRLDFILPRDQINTAYPPGSLRRVVQHDGSILHLRKLATDYDPSDRVGAMNHLQERHALGEIVTGLLYVDSSAEELHRYLNTVEKPLNQLRDAYLCPGSKALEALNASLR
jgi:2-oxoglutarate ferredoxin oxidoreductase subunit beta